MLQYSVFFMYMFNLIVNINRFTQRRQVHKERRSLVKSFQLYTHKFTLLFIFHVVYRGDLTYFNGSLVSSYVRRWGRSHSHIGKHVPLIFEGHG